MPLSKVEESLLVGAFFRGGNLFDQILASSCDQVVTLSLFYTGDISFEECVERFSRRSYVGGLYQEGGELDESVKARYRVLISLIAKHSELIEAEGNLKLPADPTYTACRLTLAGERRALALIPSFRQKPEFPNWPDRQGDPQD